MELRSGNGVAKYAGYATLAILFMIILIGAYFLGR